MLINAQAVILAADLGRVCLVITQPPYVLCIRENLVMFNYIYIDADHISGSGIEQRMSIMMIHLGPMINYCDPLLRVCSAIDLCMTM